jgi:cob(I)alamin adenosyltransferase
MSRKKSKTVTIYVPADRVAFVEKLAALPEKTWAAVETIASRMKADQERMERLRERMHEILESLASEPDKLEVWLEDGERRATAAAMARTKARLNKRRAA